MLPEFLSKTSHGMAMGLFALLVSLPGCASAGDKTLTIDARHAVDVGDMRSEISSMLEDLGYEWQPVSDPTTGQPVQVAERYGQYRMLFRAVDNGAMQIDVHVRKDNTMAALYFSESGTDRYSDTALDYFSKLKERTMLEFGADNVSDKHSFFMP